MCKGSTTSERKDEVMIRSVGSLEWPDSFGNINVDDENDVHSSSSICSIFCVGQGFLNFEKSLNVKESDQSSNDNNSNDGKDVEGGMDIGEGSSNRKKKVEKKKNGKKEINLMDLSEEELEELSYYDILGGLPLHSTADDVRKAFHRASLKYHPDKIEGENESSSSSNTKDPVFLKVKQAFETLGNAAKRKAYDSTLDFDESIPPKDVPPDDFYRIYGPVFERNLRFSKELDPSSGNDNNNKKKNKKKNKKNSPTTHLLGSDDDPIEKVHAFYDYWIHFESWRDFTLQATEQTKHDTDMAECRYEKRWMEKEIARLAKQYKKDEMARIHTMVERAMASDPRLQRERERLAREKKELAEKRQREKAENERRQREQKEAEEKRQRQLEEEEKQKREMERQKNQIAKKQLRKLKQSLRKVTAAAYPIHQSKSSPQIWNSIDNMNQDVELLCSSLSIKEMNDLLKAMGAISLVSSHNTTANKEEPDIEAVAKKVSLDTISSKAKQVRYGNEQARVEERNAIRSNEQARLKKANQKKKQKMPWSKEEVSALAKAVRKYPAGNSNRWETIATFVNNLCTGSSRNKEECIEKFNSMTSNISKSSSGGEKNESQNNDNTDKNEKDSTEWTEDQDKQLQAGLATFKASMDKNERWTAIAKGVDGKTKKECVQRFKAIRLALKKK